MNLAERCAVIEDSHYATAIAKGTKYWLEEETLDNVNCQYYIHGDDPVCDKNGNDLLDKFTKLGRFKMIKRTTGVSTTSITGKLLDLLKPEEPQKVEQFTFIQTGMRLKNFMSKVKDPMPGQKIVYYQASCDLFHPGVIERIKLAKKHGDYIYVGLWSDATVRHWQGTRFPIQCMQERLIMLLTCKYVDDVIVEAPFEISKDFVLSLNIDKVVNVISEEDKVLPEHQHVDPYKVCKEMGVYVEEHAAKDELTIPKIALRVKAQEQLLQAKFDKKIKGEEKYYEQKQSGVYEI